MSLLLLSATAGFAEGGPKEFLVIKYTGSGAAKNVYMSFKPDLLVLKKDATSSWAIFDVRRAATNYLSCDVPTEETTDANSLTSFNTDGFSLGSATIVNESGISAIAYCWQAENTDSDASHDGENYSTTTGLSIIEYTGDGGASKTINHSLGAAPKMMIVKNRDQADDWVVYHEDVAADPWTDYLILNEHNNLADDATIWSDTAPTTTQFTVGTHDRVNAVNEKYIAYLFRAVSGFSAFGAYTGNGSSTGPTVTGLGFQPGLLLIKGLDTSPNPEEWVMYDSVSDTVNIRNRFYQPADDSGEVTGGGVDFNVDGFQIRNANAFFNQNARNYVYAAFKENW